MSGYKMEEPLRTFTEKTKAETQAKLEIKLEEVNTLDRRRTEQAFPTKNITLANWAHL